MREQEMQIAAAVEHDPGCRRLSHDAGLVGDRVLADLFDLPRAGREHVGAPAKPVFIFEAIGPVRAQPAPPIPFDHLLDITVRAELIAQALELAVRVLGTRIGPREDRMRHDSFDRRHRIPRATHGRNDDARYASRNALHRNPPPATCSPHDLIYTDATAACATLRAHASPARHSADDPAQYAVPRDGVPDRIPA